MTWQTDTKRREIIFVKSQITCNHSDHTFFWSARVQRTSADTRMSTKQKPTDSAGTPKMFFKITNAVSLTATPRIRIRARKGLALSTNENTPTSKRRLSDVAAVKSGAREVQSSPGDVYGAVVESRRAVGVAEQEDPVAKRWLRGVKARGSRTL